MISGFFKRLTAEEYFQEVEKNAATPTQRTVKAIIHSPPPCSNELPSPSSSNPSRRSSSNVFLHVQDEIKVLEEMDANLPPQEKKKAAGSTRKRKKSIIPDPDPDPSADMENDSLNQPYIEENEETSNERTNKLTIRLKKKSRKLPINKEKDSDSDDIGLNFVEKDEENVQVKEEEEENVQVKEEEEENVQVKEEEEENVQIKEEDVQEKEASSSNIFCLMMSQQKSKKSSVESSPKPPKSHEEPPKQIEASVQKVSSDDGSLDFLKDVPKVCNKLKRPRSKKIKTIENDHLDAPSSPSEEVPRRISSRIKNKRVILNIKNLSSSSDEEETEVKKAPRKKMKMKRGTQDVKDDDSLSTPNSNLDKKAKLASIFVRESPEVSAARKAFLQSTAPEGIERLREQEMSAEALGYDYFNDFSFVPHINYKIVNSERIKSTIRLKDISYADTGSLPEKPKLSWLLSSTQTENSIKDGDDLSSYSLPLSNQNVYFYAQSETASSRESLLNIMKREIKDSNGTPWTMKYAPRCSAHILGNHNHILTLKMWLNSFSTKNKSNFRDSDAESCSSFGEFGANAVVLYGPHGCGKTSAVYALALELGLKVLEVNASSYRSGRQFMNMTHEATQSHRVSRGAGSEAHKGVSALFKAKKALNEQPSSKNDSLILVEDIDLFFEDGDEGFYRALSGVIGTSKRPIILTYSSNKALSIPLPKIDQISSYQFKKVSFETTAQYLSSIALREGYPVTLESLRKLVESFDGNIGRSLLSLEFFCLSSKKTTGSRISPPLSVIDTSFKQFLNISSKKSQIRQKPDALNLLPTKITAPTWCQAMHSKDSSQTSTASPSSKRHKYSRNDIEKMEALASNLENHSISYETYHPHDDLRKDSLHSSAGDQVLEYLYKLPNKTPSFLHTDVLPVIRSMARIEEERRNLNSKRRFLHYFHSQLELPISSEDLSLLRSSFKSS